MKKIFDEIVNGLNDYVHANNLQSLVLGISGGIDSTVCAAICHEVEKLNKGEIKFYGISLPCSTNSDEENDSAESCMRAFCRVGNFWTENLQKESSLLFSTCTEHIGLTPIGRGNIKARLRMIYLYDLAQKTRGIVIDTDNLTEHYLGFFTLHGDQGDIKPIGRFWKHEVYDLATWLKNSYYFGSAKIEALEKAIQITPTDGNGVILGGGDLDQIAPGFNYDQVDKVLSRYVSGKTQDEIIEEFCSSWEDAEENIKAIISRVERNKFKRLPIKIL